MSVNDPIGDMLTRIRNAQERGKSKVSTPHSRLRENVLNVLQGEGFIRGYAVVQLGSNKADKITGNASNNLKNIHDYRKIVA